MSSMVVVPIRSEVPALRACDSTGGQTSFFSPREPIHVHVQKGLEWVL